MSDDITVEILKDIRGETRETNEQIRMLRLEVNERLDHVNERLDDTNDGLEQLRQEMIKRDVALETRQATRVVAQTSATRDLYEKIIGQQELRDRVEQCERDIAELKRRS